MEILTNAERDWIRWTANHYNMPEGWVTQYFIEAKGQYTPVIERIENYLKKNSDAS